MFSHPGVIKNVNILENILQRYFTQNILGVPIIANVFWRKNIYLILWFPPLNVI